MNEDKIVAAHLAAAIIMQPNAPTALLPTKLDPGAAAKLYFECLDALIAETKKRPPGPTASFGRYGSKP